MRLTTRGALLMDVWLIAVAAERPLRRPLVFAVDEPAAGELLAAFDRFVATARDIERRSQARGNAGTLTRLLALLANASEDSAPPTEDLGQTAARPTLLIASPSVAAWPWSARRRWPARTMWRVGCPTRARRATGRHRGRAPSWSSPAGHRPPSPCRPTACRGSAPTPPAPRPPARAAADCRPPSGSEVASAGAAPRGVPRPPAPGAKCRSDTPRHAPTAATRTRSPTSTMNARAPRAARVSECAIARPRRRAPRYPRTQSNHRARFATTRATKDASTIPTTPEERSPGRRSPPHRPAARPGHPGGLCRPPESGQHNDTDYRQARLEVV
jgi:hypothetical protein